MQTATTFITAAALLWHTLVGCCAQVQGGPDCGHSHDAAVQAADEHAHSHGCLHDHGDPVETNSEPVDHETPTHPCRCHCEGNGCVAVTIAAAWQVDAPQATFDFVPFVCSSCAHEITAGSRQNGGHWSPLALALPVRAHLYYQILLI